MHALRILLVEDDYDSGEALSLLLRREGFQVEWAREGGDALASLSSNGIGRSLPDALVLDLTLPDMDATQLVRRLPAQASKLPVILYSAAAEPVVRAASRSIHALAGLQKPGDCHLVLEALHRIADDPARPARDH